MRKLTTIFLLTFQLLATIAISQNGVAFRLIENDYSIDSDKVTVDIQIKATEDNFVLADQYYRFYYDSKNMTIDEFSAESFLPGELYYDVEVIESIEGFNASEIGALDYDANLGFVNLFIELSDLVTGGAVINTRDGWVTVASVDFAIENTEIPVVATWARENKTNQYASAYSLISEWVQPQLVETVSGEGFEDLFATPNKSNVAEVIDIQVGPNPTADFIKISSNLQFESEATVTLRNLNGVKMLTQVVGGQNQAIVSLNDFTSGTYLVEVQNGNNAEKQIEKIIFTRS